MRRSLPTLAILLAALLLPALAWGHPPAADPHNSCHVRDDHRGDPTPPVPVQGTLSYLDALGASPLPCVVPPDAGEFGSHADPCPPPPFTGPAFGVYCGPVVPPAASATCTWRPVQNTVPTELIIGFDAKPFNGRVNLVADGERPVFGPYAPGSWTVWNPYAVSGRVMAFPTNVAPPGDPLWGVLAPNDVNEVICVTP